MAHRKNSRVAVGSGSTPSASSRRWRAPARPPRPARRRRPCCRRPRRWPRTGRSRRPRAACRRAAAGRWRAQRSRGSRVSGGSGGCCGRRRGGGVDRGGHGRISCTAPAVLPAPRWRRLPDGGCLLMHVILEPRAMAGLHLPGNFLRIHAIPATPRQRPRASRAPATHRPRASIPAPRNRWSPTCASRRPMR